jgi:hypothetical protein
MQEILYHHIQNLEQRIGNAHNQRNESLMNLEDVMSQSYIQKSEVYSKSIYII